MSLESVSIVTQTAYDQAEAVVIALLRYNAPNLDLRRGTVLRELLVRPAASFYALNAVQNVQQQQVTSLQTISAAPSTATANDVNKILANFNITQRVGSVATGVVKVSVSSGKSYYVPDTFVLQDLNGLKFDVTQAYTVTLTPDANNASQLQLYTVTAGSSYYFLLPMVAAGTGTEYELAASTSLDPVTSFDGYVSAAVYSTFSGGTDTETIAALIARLPAAISYRSLEDRTSIEAMLRAPEFGNFDTDLQALSVQGMGDAAQLRDKHNPWGTSVGARVDIYPRNFVQPTITTLSKTGTLVAANSYQIEIAATEAPGFYAIRAITDVGVIDTADVDPLTLPSLGSYAFTEVRTADATAVRTSGHDIDLDENTAVEVNGTVYQASTLVVTGVPGSGSTRQFKVELYTCPKLADMQTYIDTTATRSVKADCLVRCPQIALVSVRAHLTVRLGTASDLVAVQDALLAYINSRSFVSKLTASELLAIIHQYNVLRVDMTGDTHKSFKLDCVVRDAAGVTHTLTGNDLDLTQIADATNLLTSNTCVFGSLAERINLTVAYE